ncbi:unnamed protein product [Lactuca saligna]|uniref:BED-type domain-containing protein n=1 Tax=Lactuca saligna TaxID=75948 RepID=A0AA35Z8V3_LACSI|nr:unnamed protein product [Lactuca saligna]
MVLDDPGRRYGVQDPNTKNNFTCTFCGQVTKGGVYRLKIHLIGGHKYAKKCPNFPEHAREECRAYMQKKGEIKAHQHMEANFRMQQQTYGYEGIENEEEDVIEISALLLEIGFLINHETKKVQEIELKKLLHENQPPSKLHILCLRTLKFVA